MRRIFLTVFLFLCLVRLSAQTVGGLVKDAHNEAPLSGALVILQEQASGRIDSMRTNGNGSWSFMLTGVAGSQANSLPADLVLYPNYPNPFNPGTMIAFSLPHGGAVRVVVHNALGQLADEASAVLSAGTHRISWQAKGAAGLYFYAIYFDRKIVRGKMIQLDGGSGQGLGGFAPGIFADASRTESASRSDRYQFLPKSGSSLAYRIIFSRFGYCPDSLSIDLAGGEYIVRALETVHARALVIDLHNDILERMFTVPGYHLIDRHAQWQTDLPRLREGGIDLQLFAVWVDPVAYPDQPFVAALQMLERLESEAALTNGGLRQVRAAAEIGSGDSSDTVEFIIGVEGGHVIENDLDKLYQLYHRGVRLLTITWNNSTDWATSCNDANKNSVGLSAFGRKVIGACDSLGIVIDVSHVGPKSIEDILATSRNPIIASHSGAYALYANKRNLTDAQISAIAKSGGVVGVIFYPPFLAPSRISVTIETVIAHIDHIVQVAGIDYVAIGSDFDGVSDFLPAGLKDTSAMPALTLALLQHGYTSDQVEKILGKNILRVFNHVCP